MKKFLLALAMIFLSASVSAETVQIYNQDWGVGDQAVIWDRDGTFLHSQGQISDDYVIWNRDTNIQAFAGEWLIYQAAAGSGMATVRYFDITGALIKEYNFAQTTESSVSLTQNGYIQFPTGTVAWEYNKILLLKKVQTEPPVFSAIPPKTIEMNSSPTYHLLDIWFYVSDADTAKADLELQITGQSNPSLIECHLNNSHYVGCFAPAHNQTGTTEIELTATDPQGNSDTTVFTIEVVDNTLPEPPEPPHFIRIPNQKIDKDSAASYHLLDLWRYVYDEEYDKAMLLLSVSSQSNSGLINCFVEDGHFISCSAPTTGQTGKNIVTVRAENPAGLYDTKSFEVNVVDPEAENNAPEIRNLPDKEIGKNAGAQRKMLHLPSYASDDQTPVGDLNYNITEQSNTDVIECFIESNHYLSCFAPKRKGYTDITIQVRDSFGRTDDDTMRITIIDGQGPSGIKITAETDTVFMGRNASAGTRFFVKNNSSQRQCLDFSAETDSAYVEAVPATESICLNPSEQTAITLNITTIDAPASSFGITFIAESPLGISSYTIQAKTVSDADLELIVFDGDICRGEKDYFTVIVKNNTNEFKKVKLIADNEMLLPYFSPKELSLDAFEESYTKVFVYAGSNTLLGNYNVSLLAESNGELAKKTANVNIKDCLDEEVDFTLSVASGCQYADKGETERIDYTVRNLSENEVELRVAVKSDLPVDYDRRISVEGNDSENFSLEVKPRDTDTVGKHELTIIVWDYETGKSVERQKCVYVRRAEASQIEVIGQDFKVARCGSQVFSLLVRNTGDIEVDYRISVIEDFDEESISIDVSDSRFKLDEKEEKYVYISVTTAEDTPLGEYSFDIIVKTGDESLVETIVFEVVEELPEAGGDLEILSYPIQVKVEKGKKQSFIVNIRNNTGETQTASVELFGLPAGAKAPTIEGISIEPGQTMAVELYLDAANLEEGVYNAQLEARTSSFKTTKDIQFAVRKAAETAEEEETEQGNGFLAGLFVAGGNVLLGLVVLVIVIILILLMGKAIRGSGNKSGQKEAWMNKKEVWAKGA